MMVDEINTMIHTIYFTSDFNELTKKGFFLNGAQDLNLDLFKDVVIGQDPNTGEKTTA